MAGATTVVQVASWTVVVKSVMVVLKLSNVDVCWCSVDGDYRVVRSCATSGRVGQCVDRTGTSKIKLRYCECQNKSPDEPCNGSLHSAPPMSLWMSVLAAATFVITAMHAWFAFAIPKQLQLRLSCFTYCNRLSCVDASFIAFLIRMCSGLEEVCSQIMHSWFFVSCDFHLYTCTTSKTSTRVKLICCYVRHYVSFHSALNWWFML